MSINIWKYISALRNQSPKSLNRKIAARETLLEWLWPAKTSHFALSFFGKTIQKLPAMRIFVWALAVVVLCLCLFKWGRNLRWQTSAENSSICQKELHTSASSALTSLLFCLVSTFENCPCCTVLYTIIKDSNLLASVVCFTEMVHGLFGQSKMCNNYVPQWWVEFIDEFSWFFY